MHNAHFDGSFAGWREVARALLQQGVPPHQVNWLGDGDQGGLFDRAPDAINTQSPAPAPHIPKQLLGLLQSAARNHPASRLYCVIVDTAAAPGAAICIVSLAFNLLGDGLRDALDPKA